MLQVQNPIYKRKFSTSYVKQRFSTLPSKRLIDNTSCEHEFYLVSNSRFVLLICDPHTVGSVCNFRRFLVLLIHIFLYNRISVDTSECELNIEDSALNEFRNERLCSVIRSREVFISIFIRLVTLFAYYFSSFY